MKKWSTLTALFFISTLTLWNAFPYFRSEIQLISGSAYLKKVSIGRDVSEAKLDLLLTSQTAALVTKDQPKIHANQAMIHMYMSARSDDIIVSKVHALQALQELEIKLKQEPLDTYSWLRKSLAHVNLDHDKNLALEAWRTSIEIAPSEPSILNTRIHMGIQFYKFMTGTDKITLKKLVQNSYAKNPRRLKRFADRNELTGWVLFLLIDDKEKYEHFAKIR